MNGGYVQDFMDFKKLFRGFVVELLIPSIYGIAIGLIVNLFVGFTSVRGESMYPTLNDRDFLMLNKISKGNIENGDIVVFDVTPELSYREKIFYIKRVIGKSGDHVVIKDGKVIVNDIELNEVYTDGSITEGEIDILVPDGSYFVLGDNRDESSDSRVIGLVSHENVTGVVKMRLYPFNKIEN